MTYAKTIKQALTQPHVRRALNGLVGCPEGGWGETQQALQQIQNALPRREERDYSCRELISTALTLNHANRYAWRPEHS